MKLSRCASSLFVSSVLAALAGLAHAAPVPVDRIAAVVNEQVITASDVEQRAIQVARQLKRQGVALPPVAQLRSQVLDRLISEALIDQEARNTGLQIDAAMLDRAVQTIADNNKLSLAQLRASVERDENMSWAEFRLSIRSEILQARLRERDVDSRILVSEAEVDAFLASPEAAANGREYLASHILFRAAEGAKPEQWDALEQRAREVTRLLSMGNDFAKLAASFSDAQDAMQGGSLDWRSAERLPVLLVDALPGLQKGGVTPVLRSAVGLHLFKLVDVREAAAKTQTVEQTRARHILLRTPDVASESDVRRRLADLADRLKNGTDFAELARLSSADGSAAKGGDLGWLSPGETVPDFERAMNALKIGEISAPVKSPFGWHLIQVQERRTVDVTADRRRETARNALRDRKSDEAYEEWLRQLRDRAYVDIRNADR